MAEIHQLGCNKKSPSFNEMLEEFWRAYPIKTKKLWVKRALGKALHEDTFENIMAGLGRYKLCDKVLNGYVLDPQNWLSAGCWMDEGPPPKREATPAERLKSKAWLVSRLIRTTGSGPDSAITSYDLKEMVEKSLITQEQAERW